MFIIDAVVFLFQAVILLAALLGTACLGYYWGKMDERNKQKGKEGVR